MNEIGNWMQIHWYELGILLVQSAFLTAAVWFARKILKTMRASQEQLGALLKLSLSDALSEPVKAGAASHRSTPYVMAEWPTVAEAPAFTLPEIEPRGRRPAAACRGLLCWLQAPMTTHGLAPWRKAVRWLQAPARS